MNGILWSDDEIAILRAHYEQRGPSWDGWESLLPDRSKHSIRSCAMRIGVNSPQMDCDGVPLREKRARERKQRRERERLRPPDPREQEVSALMHKGIEPSRIDKLQGWADGTARAVMTKKWLREKEQQNG